MVDEAHHLSAEVLEEIRLLTNLETAQEKLLQILLVGQPELDEKLDSVELRQLKQRIALRSLSAALDLAETKGYIERRLQLAGANSETPEFFPAETIAAIYRYSNGFPRLINTVCENASLGPIPNNSERNSRNHRRHCRRIPPGSVQPSSSWSGNPNQANENGVPNAARMLLELYERLQKAAGARE